MIKWLTTENQVPIYGWAIVFIAYWSGSTIVRQIYDLVGWLV